MITGVCFLIAALAYFGMEWNLSSLGDEKKRNEQEIASLKTKIDEVQRYETLNKDIEQRVRVIESLRKNQAAPVRLLDEVGSILNAIEGVWLTSMSYKSEDVTLDGYAFTNEALVSFVDGLKKSPRMTDVTLVESSRATQDAITVYKFKLNCKFRL
jgi:type IV pilus assembly protein PilN